MLAEMILSDPRAEETREGIFLVWGAKGCGASAPRGAGFRARVSRICRQSQPSRHTNGRESRAPPPFARGQRSPAGLHTIWLAKTQRGANLSVLRNRAAHVCRPRSGDLAPRAKEAALAILDRLCA